MRTGLRALVILLLGCGFAAGAPRDDPERACERRLETDVAEYVRDRFGLELRTEEPLRRAARELSLVRAAGLEVEPQEFLRAAESQQGVLDPFPYVCYGSAPEGREAEVLARLRSNFARLPAHERTLYTHVAAGVVTRSRRHHLLFRSRTSFVTLLLTQRALSFAPIPFDVEPGERFRFEGEIYRPFREPEVLLTLPDGKVVTLDNLALEAGAFRAYVSLDHGSGEYQLEVLGRDDMGPRVLGLGSIQARAPGEATAHEKLMRAARLDPRMPPAPGAGALRAARTPEEAEARMLALVNRDRRRAGLQPLALDPGLATLARAHSRDMQEHGFFAHVSPRTGPLLERAEGANLRYRRIGENIAIDHDVDAAEAALLRSPGHRALILDGDFTHVGIGVALASDADGETRVFVTQNFLVPAP